MFKILNSIEIKHNNSEKNLLIGHSIATILTSMIYLILNKLIPLRRGSDMTLSDKKLLPTIKMQKYYMHGIKKNVNKKTEFGHTIWQMAESVQ